MIYEPNILINPAPIIMSNTPNRANGFVLSLKTNIEKRYTNTIAVIELIDAT